MTFFLTDSATTEIYTYGHTLSLHDALPISNNQLATPEAGFILARRGILFAPDYVMNAGGIISGLEATNSMPGRSRVDRSEEHTSELQSLMRISYAVFCLKKKNKKYRKTN